MKCWEIIADKLITAGFTWEYCSAAPEGGGRGIVAAYKNGQRHIVHSDALLTGFLELEATLLCPPKFAFWDVLKSETKSDLLANRLDRPQFGRSSTC